MEFFIRCLDDFYLDRERFDEGGENKEAVAHSAVENLVIVGSKEISEQKPNAQAPKLRIEFPETWIWVNSEIGYN